MSRSVKVAVIGAGVSGLVAARELQREGHHVIVYERGSKLGGMWLYDPGVDSDPLGLNPARRIVHSSIYKSLRTNTPRQIMRFSDYAFDAREGGDARDFPRHEEVLKFLENFAVDFGLVGFIRFNEEVVQVEEVANSSIDHREWIVRSIKNGEMGSSREEIFDAVVVCNGRLTEPRIAKFPGIEEWTGNQMHSHNYRMPEPFQDQVVAIIGAGASAYDISREIATVAKEVHLSSRSPDVKISKLDGYPNIWQHSKIDYVCKDGTVAFQDGFSVHADTIIHCTGYKYHFPFLQTKGTVTVEDNRVRPLYKHLFPPQFAPSLSFVGIPQRCLFFLMVELQCKWIANVLSGKVLLPSKEEMLADVENHYKQMMDLGFPKHSTHILDPLKFDNLDWIAAQLRVSPPEDHLKDIYRRLYTFRLLGIERSRDEFQVGSNM